MLNEEARYQLMRLIHANPMLSQRDVAAKLGISLGRANYCFRAMIDKGWIKARNFRNSRNKAAYIYLLTPRGIEQKARLTLRFLKIKMNEYERLKVEIEQIRREAQDLERK